jgi:alanine-glyoxylate transaminase/serine-glyoxylate transaminase/serine-pyruvate transaminase
MIPGPGALSDDVLAVLGTQLMAHYGEVWPPIHAEVVASVGKVLGCRDPYLLPGTGSAALDAALFNLFEPGQRVVVPDTGYFGERLVEMGRGHGLAVREVPGEVGAPVSPERVADSVGGADGLLCVHVETSTGVRHPVEDLARLAREAGAAFLVDGIASAGGEAVSVDELGADAFVTASQKGLEAPPGIGVVALSQRGRERIESRSSPCPSWYFDLRRWERHRREDAWEPHPVTMPTNLLVALLVGAERILEEGVEHVVRRRADLARRCRSGLADLGFELVPAEGHEANLVVAAWADDPSAVAERVAREAGITIARGLGPTEGRAIRIGLVGRFATDTSVDRLLAALS